MRYGLKILPASDSEDDADLGRKKIEGDGEVQSDDSEDYLPPVKGQGLDRTPPLEEQQFKRYLGLSRRSASSSPLRHSLSTVSGASLRVSPLNDKSGHLSELRQVRRVSHETTNQRVRRLQQDEQREIENLMSQVRLESSRREKDDEALQDRQKQAVQKTINTIVQQVEAELRAQKEAREKEERLKVEAARRAAEARAAEEESTRLKAQRAEELLAEEAAAADLRNASSSRGSTPATEALQELHTYRALMTKVKSEYVTAVRSNDVWRKAVFQLKKKITKGLGQLTNTKKEIYRITEEISNIFTEARNMSDPVYYWVLNHTSKGFIKQAESEVAVKPDSAFPLAHVMILLCLIDNHAEWSHVFLARVVKKCPYVLAVFLQRTSSSQSDDEWYKELGWKIVNGVRESKEVYAERMQGIFALYAACLQTTPDLQSLGQKGAEMNENTMAGLICKELRPNRLWVWLARMTNTTPRDMTPVLVTTFLEIAGDRFIQMYGRQSTKILEAIKQATTGGGSSGSIDFPKGTVGGPAFVRLTILLDDWEKSGRRQLNQITGRTYLP